MGPGGWFRGGQGRRRRRRRHGRFAPRSLAELMEGELGVLEELDLPEEVALRLMELGFLPGTQVVAGKAAPGGDPRVYRVDGSEIALRNETSAHLLLKPPE
ncbi:ferrous iron transport protein A [Gemmatimonadota bacterium]